MNEHAIPYIALAVTLDGNADADERRQAREYIKRITTERSELHAEVHRLRMLNERIAHDEMLVQMANDSLRSALESLLDSTGPKIDESGRMMWGGHDVVESMRYNLPKEQIDYRDLAYRTANRGGDVGALIDVAAQAQNELDTARQRIAELEAQIKREDDLWVLPNNGETVQLRFVRRTVSPTKEHPVSAKLGKTIVRPEFPVNPADYE